MRVGTSKLTRKKDREGKRHESAAVTGIKRIDLEHLKSKEGWEEGGDLKGRSMEATGRKCKASFTRQMARMKQRRAARGRVGQ